MPQDKTAAPATRAMLALRVVGAAAL